MSEDELRRVEDIEAAAAGPEAGQEESRLPAPDHSEPGPSSVASDTDVSPMPPASGALERALAHNSQVAWLTTQEESQAAHSAPPPGPSTQALSSALEEFSSKLRGEHKDAGAPVSRV